MQKSIALRFIGTDHMEMHPGLLVKIYMKLGHHRTDCFYFLFFFFFTKKTLLHCFKIAN